MNWLEGVADLATILTAGVAAYGYGTYRLAIQRRKSKIEALLEKKNQPNDDSLTLQQIAGPLKLTIEQVLEAASRSDKIEGVGGVNCETERRLRYVRNSN
jgi:hypothetical protein